ncbi:MAG: HlyD family efflux transporter periplasmic adaptor subunit [Anaerolineae bacterium]|nr:HlyD family efflux transporter periplasmic adaptor subunit [Anaerolineae bacterium]
MKRWLWALGLAIVLSGCGARSVTPAPTPVLPTEGATGGIFSAGGVVASGVVAPAQEAHLAFTVAGRVQSVAVAVGDQVQPGALLVTLETAAMEAQMAQAEAALQAAQAQLARLQEGPRPAEIAAAQAQVEAAEAAVAQAVARRDQLAGAIESEIAAARAQVAAAEAQQRQAQEAHDQTLKCYDMPDGNRVCPALGPIEEQARYALNAANAALASAQAQLEALTKGAVARKREADAAVKAAIAQRDAAQAQLDLLQAGPTSAQVAAAEAAVAQAEAALQAARVALEEAKLRAPFAGVVTALEIGPGETVLPGQAVLVLADLSRLQVKTTDLSERDVAGVRVGQQVNVSIEALGVQVAGRVVRIASQATTLGGDVVYEVVIELDEQPPGLRWGMSVEVEIIPSAPTSEHIPGAETGGHAWGRPPGFTVIHTGSGQGARMIAGSVESLVVAWPRGG